MTSQRQSRCTRVVARTKLTPTPPTPERPVNGSIGYMLPAGANPPRWHCMLLHLLRQGKPIHRVIPTRTRGCTPWVKTAGNCCHRGLRRVTVVDRLASLSSCTVVVPTRGTLPRRRIAWDWGIGVTVVLAAKTQQPPKKNRGSQGAVGN